MLKGTIRISLATYNNKSEIDYTINKLIKQLDFLSIWFFLEKGDDIKCMMFY